MSVCSSIPRLSCVLCSTQTSVGIRTPSITSGFSPLVSAEIHKKSLRDAEVPGPHREGAGLSAAPETTQPPVQEVDRVCTVLRTRREGGANRARWAQKWAQKTPDGSDGARRSSVRG
jgi:hypothetical protein